MTDKKLNEALRLISDMNDDLQLLIERVEVELEKRYGFEFADTEFTYWDNVKNGTILSCLTDLDKAANDIVT